MYIHVRMYISMDTSIDKSMDIPMDIVIPRHRALGASFDRRLRPWCGHTTGRLRARQSYIREVKFIFLQQGMAAKFLVLVGVLLAIRGISASSAMGEHLRATAVRSGAAQPYLALEQCSERSERVPNVPKFRTIFISERSEQWYLMPGTRSRYTDSTYQVHGTRYLVPVTMFK